MVVNQKCLLPLPWGWLIRICAKRLVFEFDDALWMRQGRPYGPFTQRRVSARLHWWLSNADEVTCTNDYLASYARRHSRRVHPLPTGIPLLEPIPPHRVLPADGKFTLGWSGSASSLRYLENCQQPVAKFLKKHPQARLHVLCNKRPTLGLPFEFTPWSLRAEIPFFSGLTVGLVPLDLVDAYARGKYSITSLLIMARGVPIVGNMSEGGAGEIASHGGVMVVKDNADWLDSLEKLTHAATYASYSEAALRSIVENYDIRTTFVKWRAVINASG